MRTEINNLFRFKIICLNLLIISNKPPRNIRQFYQMCIRDSIGCYTLGAVAPLSVIDTTICMGASISTLHGMEKAKGKEYIKNWV